EAEIIEADIAREMQYHPMPTAGRSRAAAARALVVRELLRREIERLGVAAQLNPVGRETAEEACIRALIEREVVERVPSEEDCRRYYGRNRARFRSSDQLCMRHIL